MPNKQWQLTDAQWQQRLDDLTYQVARKGGTERAFSGSYTDEKRTGTYSCVCCSQALFDSSGKYDSGSGWPSYSSKRADANIDEISDTSLAMERVEVRCADCAAHLEHVFNDGPEPSGLRYCINSVCLSFKPSDGA